MILGSLVSNYIVLDDVSHVDLTKTGSEDQGVNIYSI